MPAVTETLKILLVEDNPADARFLKISLEEDMPGQFELVHETYLKEALQTLSQTPFDVILLDLSLPDAGGFETLTRASVAAPDIPIVVLTGLDDEEMAHQALQAGAQDYLVKGQKDRSSLLKSLRYAIERHASQKNLVSQLEKMAFRDPLTGLLNRRGLQKALLDEMASAGFDGKNLFALMVGVNDFKSILDTQGRQAGDMVLREVASKLKSRLPGRSHLGWLWGDEFLALLPGFKAGEAAFHAEKIRAEIAESPVQWSSKTLRLSVGVGVVLVPETITTIDELSNHAHFLLDQSKFGDKNKVACSWDLENAYRRLSVPEPPGGTPLNRFYVDFQPLYRLSDNHQVGCEFFIRARLPGFEKPEDFFRLCARANVLSLVDFQALKACADFSGSMEPDLRLHFPLFPSTLMDIPTQDLLSCLPEPGNRPLYVEISQRRIVGEPIHLLEPLQCLKKAGVKIALKEVGFGSSNLESLLVLEPQVLKASKSVVDGIGESPTKVRVLKRLLKMAEGLGAELMVEGVQHPSEIEVLRGLGVPYGQGAAWKRLD